MQFNKPFKSAKKAVRVYSSGYARAHGFGRHAKNLNVVIDNTQRIRKSDVLAFVVLRNEAVRIPYFLDYYRKLGVNHFLFVDNDSTDDFKGVISGLDDCSVWHTTASYKEATFGVDWGNILLAKYGTGHWCLMLDPDEFLVYPHIDSRNLRELTEFLDQEGKESFFTVMLDMYSEGSVDDAFYPQGSDPLEICPWFDGTGYYQDKRPTYEEWWIRGGVRRRSFFAENPNRAPALNKTVLVKWKQHYRYIASTHIARPNKLNNPHFQHTLAPTGCLLHFKYLSLFRKKIEEEMERKEHYGGSIEYKRYMEGLNQENVLWNSKSTRFGGWRQCVNLGLMNIGVWF